MLLDMNTKHNTANASGDTVIVSIRMPAEEADRLREVAGRDDRSMSWVARRAINEHLDRAAA